MKRFLTLFLTVLILLSSVTVNARSDITLYINDKKIDCDVPPIIVNDRTMVPVRVIFDTFGADIKWKDSLKQVTITGDKKIVFTIGKNTATVDGKRVVLDAAPLIEENRTLVPVRFISETLGHKVSWNSKTRSVYITTFEEEKEPEPEKDKNTYQITKITSKTTDKKNNTFEIKYNGEDAPKLFYLSGTNCIVMDFYDTNLTLSDAKKTIETDFVNELRYAQHEEYARVVIECNGLQKYKTSFKNGIYKVVVGEETIEKEPETNEKTEEEIKISNEELMTKFLKTRDENNLVVVIDAGHGGSDPGAIYKDNEGKEILYEKEPNLYISKKVKEYLEDDGVNVVMTREKDVFIDLIERSEFANDIDADLFVSIHNNAIDNYDISGSMVLYNGDITFSKYGVTGKEIAKYVNEEIKDLVDIVDRGIVSRPGLSVLKRTVMPAILVECAFGTNEYDLSLLLDEDQLDLFARAITNGIEKSLDDMKAKIKEAKRK